MFTIPSHGWFITLLYPHYTNDKNWIWITLQQPQVHSFSINKLLTTEHLQRRIISVQKNKCSTCGYPKTMAGFLIRNDQVSMIRGSKTMGKNGTLPFLPVPSKQRHKTSAWHFLWAAYPDDAIPLVTSNSLPWWWAIVRWFADQVVYLDSWGKRLFSILSITLYYI